MDLLPEEELPPGFSYPGSFLRTVERGLTNLDPWWILDGPLLVDRARGLRERFPSYSLVPFAKRDDNDDVACWEPNHPGNVFVVHDYSDPSWAWERRSTYPDFYGWLRQAVEDMIEFDRAEDA